MHTKNVKIKILLVLLTTAIVSCFITKPLLFRPSLGSLSKLAAVQTTSDIGASTAESIRKWFLQTKKRRPEVFVSESASTNAVIVDTWRCILISLRVLQTDQEMREHVAVYAFPNIKVDSPDILEKYQKIAEALESDLTNSSSSPLFQPNYQRSIRFHLKPNDESGDGESTLLLSIETRRVRSELLEYDDIDKYTPSVDEMVTNDIEDFPFPNVFDFISEINRPADPFTLNELRFQFKIQDFKYDLTKMKKKKDPQEVVNSINCKLTRLANWRDILTANKGDQPDPFSDTSPDWAEQVKRKYQSLRTLAKSDPKKALDTQYDKKEVFVKIIDQWSDRLKRSFKYFYQSKRRPPEDFMKPIMESKWRNEVLNTSRVFSQVPFLDFGGPEFEPGNPQPIFDPDRVALWSADYHPEVVMTEMLVWQKRIEKVNKFVGPSAAEAWAIGPIAQHTYCRGFVTERTVFDAWQGLTRWLEKREQAAKRLPSSLLHTTLSPSVGTDTDADGDAVIDVDAIIELAKTKKNKPAKKSAPALPVATAPLATTTATAATVVDAATSKDHTEEFLSVLETLNQFSRESSSQEHKSVKETYRDWFQTGKDMSEWWTTLVRNLDLVQDMDAVAEERTGPWSEIMNDLILLEGKKGDLMGADASQFAEDMDHHAAVWKGYKPVMLNAEKIESTFPWRALSTQHITTEGIIQIGQLANFNKEIVHVDLAGVSSTADAGYMLILPCYMRGTGLDEELSAFLEFCKLVTRDVKMLAAESLSPGETIEIIPLHPLMISQKGFPDHARRAPHPSVVFRVVKA